MSWYEVGYYADPKRPTERELAWAEKRLALLFRKDHMTEGNGEQHTHEETVKDEHTNEDGTVTQETTEKTEAETNGDDE